MNKTELIEKLAKKQKHLTKKNANLAVNLILQSMLQRLAWGERIEIRGFGTFTVRLRQSRARISLKTGNKIVLPAHHAARFKPAKELRLRVMHARSKAG